MSGEKLKYLTIPQNMGKENSAQTSSESSISTSLAASPINGSSDSFTDSAGLLLHFDSETVKDVLEGFDEDSTELNDMEKAGIVLNFETGTSIYARPTSMRAKADSSGFFTECSEDFLLVSGLTTDFRTCSIISLAKFTTPEDLQQRAYMLDALATAKPAVTSGPGESNEIKWIADLENTYLNMSYEIHVTLNRSSSRDSSHVLDIELVELYCSSRSSFASSLTHHQSSRDLLNLRILVVDDSDLVLRVVSRLIRAEGHTVDCKKDGLEALEALKNIEYDAVIMDIHMPEMNGLEASFEFRNHEGLMHQYRGEAQSSKLKIIAMSSDFSEELIKEVMIAGFDGFIPKPLTLEAFRNLKLKPSVFR
jgi:CheY-like chemotaxis protein